MALVIEATDESGPCGLPAISVCSLRRTERRRHARPRDVFRVGFRRRPAPEPVLLAKRLRRHRAMEPLYSRRATTAITRNFTREHERFAKLWDNNLRQQGFAEAFERQRHQHA